MLNSPRNPGAFAALPSAGLVDTLLGNTPVEIVGYGVQGFIRGGGPPQQVFLFTRFFAPSILISTTAGLATNSSS